MKNNQKIILSVVSSVLAIACLAGGIWLSVNSTHTQIGKTKVVSEYYEDTPINSDDAVLQEETTQNVIDLNSEQTEDKDVINVNSEETKTEDTSSEREDSSSEQDKVESLTKVYYVSSSKGNDNNDGLSEDKPLKTISKVNKLDLADGDKVLFKCGDLWRGEALECANAYVTYSSYGEGEKPTFYGSYENYADESKWLPTEYPNVWVLYKKIGDVGTFSINGDKLWTVKRVNTKPEKLSNDLEHCIDYDTKEVFFYSAKGNPGKAYSSIEAHTTHRLILAKSGNTIENLKLKYADYGVQCWTGNDITVRNMDISWMGGSGKGGDDVRKGNAIEFWSNMDNIVIENNVISQCYDTGITCQYNGDDATDVTMSNIYVRNNKVSNCFWSTEFWIYMTGDGTGNFRNLQITDNVFENAGNGWSFNQRNIVHISANPWHINLMHYTNYGDRDIKISNNVFKCVSKGGFINCSTESYVPMLSGNTYVQEDNGLLGIIRNRSYTFNKMAEIIIKSIDSKATVKFAE